MISHLDLECPGCGAALLADDEFCESCGQDVAGPRDARRDHVELDLGIVAGASDRGHVHLRNEDAMYIDVVRGTVVAVVCDGVSTSAAPQLAASLAAAVAGGELTSGSAATAESPARHAPDPAGALAVADRAVRSMTWSNSPDRSAPACTAVAATWDGVDLQVGWAGDSRCYWVVPAGVSQLTSDHSWAQEQVDAGLMTPEVAEADRRAHVITRWLGDDGLPAGAAHVVLRPVEAGRLVLCTDGLWNHVPDAAELGRLIGDLGTEAPAGVATSLTRTALDRGGRDNVTVVVVDVRPAASPDPTEPTQSTEETS